MSQVVSQLFEVMVGWNQAANMKSTLLPESTRKLGLEVCKYSTAGKPEEPERWDLVRERVRSKGPLEVLSKSLMVRLLDGAPE
jgi:hypothetical protein